jgi:DNA phosphorothioation-dependent restriction protein DptH
MVISTQNPSVLHDEMLELVSVAVIHQFHSPDWFRHLAKKLPMPEVLLDQILDLESGEALVFAKKEELPDTMLAAAKRWHRMRVRERLTQDAGGSVTA